MPGPEPTDLSGVDLDRADAVLPLLYKLLGIPDGLADDRQIG